jgi:hypothetical protein
VKTVRRLSGLALFAVLCFVWWVTIVDYALARPGDTSNHHSVYVFLGLVAVSTPLHVWAYRKFNRMLQITRRAEEAGLAERGSGLFAENQRFRYLVRTLESCYLIVLSGLAFYASEHPAFLLNRNYGKFVLTYFFGTIMATAYLTYRDLRVLECLRKMDRETRAARLVGVPDVDDA